MVSQAAIAGPLFPKVVVTIPPLVPYTDAILGSAGDAESLLRPGQDPHSFALAPSQARMLDAADIVIIPDLDMSPFLKRVLASKPKLQVIELSKLPGAEPLPYAKDNPWIAAVKKAGGDKPEAAPTASKPVAVEKAPAIPVNDPHLWLDPERMAAIAAPLAAAIADHAPEMRPTLSANAATLSAHLRGEVIPALREILQPRERNIGVYSKPEIAFITYHAAYQYFLTRFGIAHQGEIMSRPEDYIGAKTLDTLLTTAKSIRLRCIIGEQSTPLVERIATYSGAKIILLSPEQNVTRAQVDALDWIHNDYDRLLYKTAKSFGECL
ncbi:MAG: zinc ABC transporter substrate-binding protein [Pseudomonadota bacterium]